MGRSQRASVLQLPQHSDPLTLSLSTAYVALFAAANLATISGTVWPSSALAASALS